MASMWVLLCTPLTVLTGLLKAWDSEVNIYHIDPRTMI